MAKAVATLVAVALVVAAVSAGWASAAAECAPGKLAPCLPSITKGAVPTPECCSNLSAQQGCFCQYARNPAYGSYLGANARVTLRACGIALPTC